MKKDTALVLTGGGAKAAYQAGVVVALAEIFPSDTSPFQIISGTSAGAINAAFLAANAHNWNEAARKLQNQWATLTLDQVYRTDSLSLVKIALGWLSRTMFGGKFLKNAKANYMLDTSPLEETLNKSVDFSQIQKNIADQNLRAVSFTMVQYFSTNRVTYFDSVSEIEPWIKPNRFGIKSTLNSKHVMASSAIPIFFPPIEIDSKFYGDGSLRQTTPLSAAIHLGAKKILSIGIRHERSLAETVQNYVHHTPPSLAQISGELMNSIFLDSMDMDIERLESINKSIDLIEQNPNIKNTLNLKRVKHLHLSPSKDLQSLIPLQIKKFPLTMRFLFHGLGASKQQGNNLMGYLSFLPECSKPLMDLGYEDTMKKKNILLDFFSK